MNEMKIDSDSIPRLCGTCRKRDVENGYCLMWCRPTESTASCEYWMPEEDIRQNKKPICPLSRDQLAQKIGEVVWDEIGGYEASHPWMSGATESVKARVMVLLDELGFFKNEK